MYVLLRSRSLHSALWVWHCASCSALRGTGITYGLRWLADTHTQIHGVERARMRRRGFRALSRGAKQAAIAGKLRSAAAASSSGGATTPRSGGSTPRSGTTIALMGSSAHRTSDFMARLQPEEEVPSRPWTSVRAFCGATS